jgi:predicted RecB family nuclease
MRLTASDFISYHRPTRCDLRVFLRDKREAEAAPGPYDEVLRRLGLKHEKDHLATLGAFTDVRDASFREQVKKTADAIAKRVPILYQAAFLVTEKFGESEVEIVGVPDFLILDGGGYLIRDVQVRGHPFQIKHDVATWAVFEWLKATAASANPTQHPAA